MKTPTEVESFFAMYPPEVQDLARGLRKLIIDTVAEATEMVDTKDKVIGYGFGEGYKDLICTIIPSKDSVKLGVVRGADLADPTHLLEGDGKVHRHIQFESSADLTRPGVKPLLEAAVAAWQDSTAKR